MQSWALASGPIGPADVDLTTLFLPGPKSAVSAGHQVDSKDFGSGKRAVESTSPRPRRPLASA
eukprot:4532305-Alexandrium_andersonii.AAC.1